MARATSRIGRLAHSEREQRPSRRRPPPLATELRGRSVAVRAVVLKRLFLPGGGGGGGGGGAGGAPVDAEAEAATALAYIERLARGQAACLRVCVCVWVARRDDALPSSEPRRVTLPVHRA